jgi:hypothetical protein
VFKLAIRDIGVILKPACATMLKPHALMTLMQTLKSSYVLSIRIVQQVALQIPLPKDVRVPVPMVTMRIVT